MIRNIYILLLLSLLTTGWGENELLSNNIHIQNELRDEDCKIADIEFCDPADNNSLYSEFVCEWVCKQQHNTQIQKCSSQQYYSSINDNISLNIYNSLYYFLNTGLDPLNFNYDGFIHGSQSYNNNMTIGYIHQDTSTDEGYWDWNENGEFDMGNGDSENYKYGWGHFIYNSHQDSDPTIAIHVNHPQHDENSDFLAGYIFNNQELKPKWMITSGAHRYSKVDTLHPPEDCYCSNNDDYNYGADVARNYGINSLENDPNSCLEENYIQYTTPFQVYHEALSDNIEGLYTISVHGFENLDMENPLLSPYEQIPSFIITNGNSHGNNDCIPPDEITSTIYHYLKDYFSGQGIYNTIDLSILEIYQTECADQDNIAVIVQQEINCEYQPTTCSDGDSSPFQEKGGYHNPQGRYTNGYNDNINVGNSSVNNDNWVQIEIHDCIRDSIDLYEKVASIISSAIIDCKNEMCVKCEASTPCSSPMGNGVDYGIYEFNCSEHYVYGCTDPSACNYDESANADDGSCAYEFDCVGTCGGDLEPDCCGVCGGDNSQCSNCCGMPFNDDCTDDCYEDYNTGECCPIWEVDECGVCFGDGSSCDGTLLVPSEFPTIQSAIDAAVEGDSVLVSAGTYYENINFNGKNIAVIGEDMETTIIDGGHGEDGSCNVTSSVAVFESGETNTALLQGFTIQHGCSMDGGGVLVKDSSPTFSEITFNYNRADQGGGIYLDNSSSSIMNVLFINNESAFGGGMYFHYSNPILTNVTFSGNIAEQEQGGGGMFLNSSSPTLTDVTFNGNTAEIGGGMYLHNSSSPILTNSILWGNSPQEIFISGSDNPSSIEITYSNIQGGEAGIVINDNGTMYWGDGNIDEDPLFCDAENGDLTIADNSPCVGTGQDGADMGALGVGCEGNDECDLGDVNCDGILNVLDVVIIINIVLVDGYDEIGDMNGDGQLDILDIVILINLILNAEGVIMDIDGNVYLTVQIGDQLWMAENLKVTHYNDNSEIPNITNNGVWGDLSTGAYCDYDNNPSNSETYGRLYNWYTVDDDSGVCPDGYHVPSDEEFMELEMYLGMSEEEANNTGWRGTNEGSKLAGNSDLWGDGDLVNNSEFGTSGFTALPAGYRNSSNGYYYGMGNLGYFWSSSEPNSSTAWYRKLGYYYSNVYRFSSHLHYGFSIRCLGD